MPAREVQRNLYEDPLYKQDSFALCDWNIFS